MRASFAWAVLSVPLLVGCGSAPSGSDAEPGTSAAAIAGGTLDTDHPAVFEEVTHYSSGVSSCTASLIAPNVLLTARHCVSQGNSEHVMCGQTPFATPVAGTSTIATGDAVPSGASTFYHGAEVRVPTTGDDICGYDVALLVLQAPIPASEVTPLIPRIDRPVETGEPYVAVGYGVDDKGDQNPGRMVLGDLSVRCLADECEMPFGVAPSEFMGAAGICSGDSGGPALDSDGKIIGIVSRGTSPCATPIYSQVASWSDFITQTVLSAAADAGYRPPFWAFSGSSDLSPDLLGEGEHCSSSSECEPGMACYYASNPADATCTPVCANDKQCGTNQECRPGFDVQGGGLCLAPASAEPPSAGGDAAVPPSTKVSAAADNSCAVSARPNGSTGSSRVVALVFGFGLLLRRRARRR